MTMKKSTVTGTLAPQWVSSVAVAGALAVAPAAVAQTASEGVADLGSLTATASSMKPTHAASSKFTRPLLNTPQSVHVIPKEVLEQQNAQTLEEVLRNVPGVTFAAGEGGAGWGDMFTIRGMQAEQAVTVDEVREGALSTRTDTFNLETVNVYKGSGSVESGGGMAAFGGSVNLVSKKPFLGSLNHLHLGVGTDDYRRATVDFNRQLGDGIALRINAMGHQNTVADRDPVEMKRWGFAPSISFGLGTPTRVTASYFYQKDENIPDFGVPVSTVTGKPMRGVDWDFYGGYANVDHEDTEVHRLSLQLEHDFSERVRFKNTLSWAKTDRWTSFSSGGRLLNARGAPSAGIHPHSGYKRSDYWGYSGQRQPTYQENYPTGYLATARLATISKYYVGKVLSNQSTLNLDFNTGSIKHNMVVGLDLYKESYRNKPWTYTVPDVSTHWKVIDVRNPDHWWQGDFTEQHLTSNSGAEIKNIGVFVSDSIQLNRHWEVSAGLRLDHVDGDFYDNDGAKRNERYSDNLWSGRIGVVYKPVDYGSIYLSYSQAKVPSIAAMATRSGRGDNQTEYSPTKTQTWELGTKWELLNNRLALTAAIFQTEKSNPTDKSADGTDTIQHEREDRVRGIELTAMGHITDRWSVYGGFSYLDDEITKHASDPSQVGGRLKNVPDYTFNLWSNYQITDDFNVGLGAQYVGKRQYTEGYTSKRTNWGGHDITSETPSYWLVNAAATYRVHENVDVNLNVNNLFDKKYIQRFSTSSDGFQRFGVPGAGRTVILSTDIRF